MTYVLPLAASSDSTALIIAVLAGIVSVAGATISLLGTYRDREAKLQAERRDLYARLMTALLRRTVAEAGPSSDEQDVAYTLLVQRVRQASPSIRSQLDSVVPQSHRCGDAMKDEDLKRLQRAMDYQLKALLRRVPWKAPD